MTDEQIAQRVRTFMEQNDYRTIRLSALCERFTLANEPQIVSAVRRYEPGITVQERSGGDVWLIASSVKLGQSQVKDAERRKQSRRAA